MAMYGDVIGEVAESGGGAEKVLAPTVE